MATKKKILTSNLQAVAEIAAQHEPGQPLPEDQAEKAASGSGYQGEEITDAELEASKPKLQVVRKNSNGQEVQVTEKPAEKKQQPKPKAVKQPKPKAEKKGQSVLLSSGYTRLTAQIVLDVFTDAKAGLDNKAIGKKHNIRPETVVWLLNAGSEPVKQFSKSLAELGATYPEKFVRSKPEKPVVKKEAEVKA